jgi:hypothetical protein
MASYRKRIKRIDIISEENFDYYDEPMISGWLHRS